MGYYINPAEQTKEDWLTANGVRLACAPDCDALVQVNALPNNWRELEQGSKERKGAA